MQRENRLKRWKQKVLSQISPWKSNRMLNVSKRSFFLIWTIYWENPYIELPILWRANNYLRVERVEMSFHLIVLGILFFIFHHIWVTNYSSLFYIILWLKMRTLYPLVILFSLCSPLEECSIPFPPFDNQFSCG